jgi:hypothetical protein
VGCAALTHPDMVGRVKPGRRVTSHGSWVGDGRMLSSVHDRFPLGASLHSMMRECQCDYYPISIPLERTQKIDRVGLLRRLISLIFAGWLPA